jgi:hypothetical protein
MRISRQLCRHLLGTELADRMAIAEDRPALATPLLCGALAGLDRARASLPALDRLAARAGRRYWDGVVAMGLAGQPAEFAPPARLLRDPV